MQPKAVSALRSRILPPNLAWHESVQTAHTPKGKAKQTKLCDPVNAPERSLERNFVPPAQADHAGLLKRFFVGLDLRSAGSRGLWPRYRFISNFIFIAVLPKSFSHAVSA
jgi:hypothetical protein